MFRTLADLVLKTLSQTTPVTMDCAVEVRRSTTLCKVQALVWNIYRDPPTSEVEVDSSSLKIVVKQGVPSVETELVFPEHMVFKPGTVSTRLERNVFRDRQEFVQPMPCIELTIEVLLEDTWSVSKLPEPRVMQAKTPLRFMCAACSAETIDDEVSFDKVLQLSSNECEEKVGGELFCHPVAEARKTRVPGVREMFFSPTMLIVHDVHVREAFFNDKQLHCRNCRWVLGRRVMDSSVALFKTRVKVERFDDQTCITYDRRETLDVLVAVIREYLGGRRTYKILVEAGNQALLLWLVERDLVFFYQREVQGKTVVVDPRLGSKVMYLVTNDLDDVVDVWKEDPLVSVYKFEKELMEDSIYYLENCCKSMGATFERFRGIFLPEQVR